MLNKIVFDMQALNLASIAPMILLSFFALGILCISMFKLKLSNRLYLSLTIMALVLDFILMSAPLSDTRGMFNLVLMDGVAAFSILIILFSSIFFMLLRIDDCTNAEFTKPEFYSLFLFMIVGYQFMVASDNLILIIIGLELSSLALYTLIALKNTNLSIEAALKYFSMGAVGTGFFVFGSAILYLVTNSVEIHSIYNAIISSSIQKSLTLYVGCVFVVVAIGFKVSLVPFHTWLPDIYEGASTPLAGYISIVPKIAAFVVALRFFNSFIVADVNWAQNLLYIIAVATMTLANITALVQKDVKRMLAFSSISNAGFIIVAILVATTQATMALFLYWSMFAIANLGAFAVVWIVQKSVKSSDDRYETTFDKFSGLIKNNPFLALIMAVFMFSLAGIPPFSLFWGKMYLIGSAVSSGYNILAVILVLNSAVAVYYYLKVVVYMFLKEPQSSFKDSMENVKYVLVFMAFLSIIALYVTKYLLSDIDLGGLVSMSGY